MGFDPSMRNWGIARGFYDPLTYDLKIVEGLVVQPDKSTDKVKSVRKNSQDLEHASNLVLEVHQYLNRWQPQALFVEVPVGSQNARAMCGYGMCIGILAWLYKAKYPFYLVTPTEVKIALGGTKTASKETMIDIAVKTHPEMNWPMYKDSVVKSSAEHIADAIGAIHAGIQKQDFINLIAITNKRHQ